ncbi:MAG: GtrA family protein [Myxococcales bacterium]|nr:GtrA family protein [Myxococcales bacterium]
MKHPRELLAAGFGGAVGTGVDVAALVLMVGHGVSVPVATFLAALAGAATNFVLNKYVAFRDHSPINLRQLARFGFVAVAAALLMAGAMKIVAVKLGVPVVLAKLACAAVVFAIWTYPAQRRLVFARTATA